MRTAATAFWEELLEYIDERRVIPVVGVELLRATPGDPASSFTKKLAAWSGASNVCLIDVDLASWMARAKAIANRKLTAGERQFYLGRLP